ncbi:reverse transcriptase domain-containing protein [Cohnella suwonensis]|uniref:Reverse transcriptase domain-containing protein n=1 Tax=Cohnella suwonensis TaxID=696072 RepID=A0ABW0LXE9_9BACL
MSASAIFNRKFTEKSVRKCYFNKIKHKCSPGIDRINRLSFENRIDEYIKVISNKALNGTYKYIPYKEKLISKGASRPPRQISVPAIRDKITLSLLNDFLSKVFENEVNHKIIQTTVDELKSSIDSGIYDHFIKVDITEFFPSIRHDVLLKKIKGKIRKKSIINLVEEALITPTIPFPSKNTHQNIKGIPQGIAIASILANIYLSNLDNYFSHKANEYKYFRYVDDILILCKKSNITVVKDDLIKSLKELHLEISPTKYKEGKLTEGFTYLGYSYKNIQNRYGFSVRDESIKKFEESLIKVFSEYKFLNKTKTDKFIWKLNKKITGCIFEKKKYGWLFFYSQIDDKKILYHFDWFVRKLCKQVKVDPNVRKRIKRFVRTFHEIIYNLKNTKYIPNFDEMDIKEQRAILRNVFDIRDVKNLKKEEVEIQFKKSVFKFIKELEKDVQDIS